MRFARTVLSRPYIFTIVFLIANIFVFLLMWRSSGMSMSPLLPFPDGVLLAYGAKLNSLINQQHEWWRFVTPMFVHVNMLHLLVNMYSLWMIGPYVEKLYGSAKFVFFWVATGVAGVVASYLTVLGPDTRLGPVARFIFKTQDAPSAGASGALFGLIGVLFVFGIKYRNELPEGFKRAFGTGLLPVITINLFIGFLGRSFIDNAAHLGGLISGAVLGLIVSYRRPGERSSLALAWQLVQVAALALVAVSFVRVVQNFKIATPAQAAEARPVGPTGKSLEFLTLVRAMLDAQEVLNAKLKDEQVNIDDAIAALEKVNAPGDKADQLKHRLETLLQRAKQLAPAPSPESAPAAARLLAQQSDLLRDYAAWKKEYEEWLKMTGKKYGREP